MNLLKSFRENKMFLNLGYLVQIKLLNRAMFVNGSILTRFKQVVYATFKPFQLYFICFEIKMFLCPPFCTFTLKSTQKSFNLFLQMFLNLNFFWQWSIARGGIINNLDICHHPANSIIPVSYT